MRPILIAIATALVLLAGYCSLPLTSVAVLTVTITDESGRGIAAGSTASYLDAEGGVIATITPETPGSWDNNLHWWVHSSHPTSTLRPKDALRAVAVEIGSPGCAPARLPVVLERDYEPPSLAPHGGGPAHFIYRYDAEVVLDCG